jgi:hypothetical protein
MWLRASTDTAGLGLRSLGVAALATLVLAACGSAPTKPTESASQPATATSDADKSGSGAAASANGASPAGSAEPVPVTPRGKADFERAFGFMKAGKITEAELEFKQVALQFPQLSSPYVNLGILYRKAGHLEQSEDALKTAVEHNDGSAVAWTELGATQRLRGEFPNAAASYEKAIAADPNFAPAYRNLGVVSDLYLGDPERALTAFERYKELTGEEKPVSGWIAELRARTGKPPLKRPQPERSGGNPEKPQRGDAGQPAPAAGSSDAAPKDGAPAAPGATAEAPPGQPGQAPGATQTTPDQKPAEPPPAAPPPKTGG